MRFVGDVFREKSTFLRDIFNHEAPDGKIGSIRKDT